MVLEQLDTYMRQRNEHCPIISYHILKINVKWMMNQNLKKNNKNYYSRKHISSYLRTEIYFFINRAKKCKKEKVINFKFKK